VLRQVAAHPRATTSQLVEATGLHENTVRGHLERLRADGHIRRERDSTPARGRPAWRWRTVPPAQLSAYAGLAATLASALGQVSAEPAESARLAGESWGNELLAQRHGASESTDTRALIIEIMREQGFAPDDEGETVRLRACPLLSAASRNSQVVCAVHEGMIDGIARANASDLESALVPFALDGACALHLRVPA
jgi:predicted ArsR family transcriptional regulator